MRVLVAGAGGAIGRRMTPLLLAAGHVVAGTTRSAARAAELARSGIEALVVDVFDRNALREVVVRVRPQVVVHQLTDLPQVLDPAAFGDWLKRNAQLRIEGTRNLVDAAAAAGTPRLVAQSIAFAYAEGPEPHHETDPLAPAEGDTPAAVSARGVRALEEAVLAAPRMEGIVLRYGRLYGPGTWHLEARGRAPLHVDAAAHAALLALTRGSPGIYNIAENDGAVTIEKARRELGFEPAFRMAN
jgi:nucleoside-diphosphate-sugar epimerase